MADVTAPGPPAAPRPGTSPAEKVVAVLAAAVQLVVLVPFTVASGLLAPLWAIVGFHVLWVAGAVVFVRLVRRRPLATPLVPLGNAVLLGLGLSAGGAWLGWTA
jgi:hypothetical protein